MTMALRCRCGAVRGEIDAARAYTRATCYCRDCQAFARFLGVADVLDAAGGTDIVPMAPAAIRFNEGQSQVRCMSLGPKGILRWYAGCCRTPLANTGRDPGLPYAGVVTACLDAPAHALDAAFGPKDRIVLNTESATAPVKPTRWRFLLGGLGIFAGIMKVRLRRERMTPFFTADGQPLATVEVISLAQRKALQQQG